MSIKLFTNVYDAYKIMRFHPTRIKSFYCFLVYHPGIRSIEYTVRTEANGSFMASCLCLRLTHNNLNREYIRLVNGSLGLNISEQSNNI